MVIEPANRTLSVKEYYFSIKNKEIAGLNARRASQGLDPVINLGIGSPDGSPAPEVIDALCDCARKPGTHGYQSYIGIPELREAMARWYKDWYGVTLDPARSELAVGVLQSFLDKYLKENPGEIDYIHDDDALIALAKQDKAIGFLLPAMEKSSLFRGVIRDGALPRKTFSMGHSREKRYYLEGRKIR